jgi:hypothetical protein
MRSWFIGKAHIGDYMRRWMVSTPFFSVRLHHILRSDYDRAMHDHPWWFRSLILRGRYRELSLSRGVAFTCLGLGADPVAHATSEVFSPGMINARNATDPHLLLLEDGATVWTLCITGPARRDWGFFVLGKGWVSHREQFPNDPG